MPRARWSASLAVAAGLSLLVAACGDDNDTSGSTTTAASDGGGGDTTTTAGGDTTTTGGGSTGEAADFKACQVTDTGGVDDGSFNQTAFEGMTRAEDDLGIQQSVLESETEADFEPNIDSFLQDDCDLIITVGFLLGDATAAAAEANTDQDFAIVDVDFADPDTFEDITYDNVRELTFSTDQAAFLAGYLAAGMTETGTVGTYGGINIPPVTIFMNGFLAGVNQYNEDNGTEVQLEGWDGTDGLFTGDFQDLTKGRDLTEQLLDAGADIIMPVAGPVGQGSIEAIRSGGGTQHLIWVDSDGCVQLPDDCDLFLTSVQKKMDNAVYDTIQNAVDGDFEGGLYVGTLENDGVGLAPFHDNESLIPADLSSRIDELKQGIIDGDIDVSVGD